MSLLIPQALAIIAIVLAVFGFLSFETYDMLELGKTWQGLVCLGAIVGVFALLLNTLRRFFQRNTGRLVFALWVISMLGAYFVFLLDAPVKERDEKTNTMTTKMRKDDKGNLVVVRDNQYPMGIDLAGGTELIYILKYDQIDRNIESTLKRIEDTKRKADEARTAEAAAKRQDPNSKLNTATTLDEKVRQLQDQLESLRKSKETAPDKAAEVLRHRVDPNGTKGIPVTTFGNNRERLRIQLPHASQMEVERIKTAIKTQGRLTFQICTDKEDIIQAAKNAPEDAYHNRIYSAPDGITYMQMTIKTPKKIRKQEFDSHTIVAYRGVQDKEMDGSHIVVALAKQNPQDGRWEIEVRFDAQGSTDFAFLTGQNLKKPMAIVLDNVAKSAPVIQSEISNVCQITGNFNKEEAEQLANVLTQGSLPAEVIEDTTFFVGPSLGAEQVQSGVLATVIATVVVILFMLLYYRLSGAIAALCMLLNLPMLLGMMGFFKATLTLPGIAGIVLTLGMAVDANVLIIERLREELARGRSLKQAVSHGFERAFLTIIDCHMTTLISSIVLYYLGTGPVRGFAVSLSMGILTTLFCNLWLNWILTEWLVNREAVGGFNMMQFFKETHIDFMGNRRLWMTLTGGAAAISFVLFVYHTSTSKDIYDVDFTGGTLIQFNFAKGNARTGEDVRKEVKDKVSPALASSVEQLVKTLKDAQAAVETKVKTENKDYAKEMEAAKNDAELAKKLQTKFDHELHGELVKVLPQNGEVIAKDASVRKGGLAESIADLEEKLKLLKSGEELTSQSFGKPEASESGKFRQFTLTTRIVSNLITGELANVLRKVYGEELEPEAVQLNDNTMTLRLKKADLSKEAVANALESAMKKAAQEPENGDIKADLLKLTVVSAAAKDDYTQAEIAGYTPANKEKPTPEETLRVQRVKQVLELADLGEARVGGPISRTNAFGAQVAKETGLMSLAALLVANLAVFVYLWFRFEFSGAWGFGAIVALIHDVVIAAGAVIVAHILGFPILINLNIVAALLTITGFSVNDTIVVFDRIREVKAAHPTRSYEDIVNEAINATLSRTILTSLTVLLSVVSLLIFGGPTIKDMAFTLLVGFLVGTYSSIFIASPLMIWWYKRFGTGRAPVPTSNRSKTDAPTAQNAHI